jgi:hypothetical protein
MGRNRLIEKCRDTLHERRRYFTCPDTGPLNVTKLRRHERLGLRRRNHDNRYEECFSAASRWDRSTASFQSRRK